MEDRKAIIGKIAAMVRLQEASTFEGESEAAAAMIDKLCQKYGITQKEVSTGGVEAIDEEFLTTGRMDNPKFVIFASTARFYDAMGYVQTCRTSGRKVSTFRCIGTEAQQIQTKLYYEFYIEIMKKECDKALAAERILSELMGKMFDTSGFRSSFYAGFADKIKERLHEMKKSRDPHEHKDITKEKINTYHFRSYTANMSIGSGSQAGQCAGSSVSLNRQATGSRTLQLTGS